MSPPHTIISSPVQITECPPLRLRGPTSIHSLSYATVVVVAAVVVVVGEEGVVVVDGTGIVVVSAASVVDDTDPWSVQLAATNPRRHHAYRSRRAIGIQRRSTDNRSREHTANPCGAGGRAASKTREIARDGVESIAALSSTGRGR
jgi:hypothetical protein